MGRRASGVCGGAGETAGPRHRWPLVVAVVAGLVLLVVGCAVACLSYCYRADETALAALVSDDAVTVTEGSAGWRFDGAGTDDLVILMGGALVDERAYAPLARELALAGIDVCIPTTPFHVALLDTDAPASVLGAVGGGYERVYVAGHSLGGVVAADYCAAHPGDVCGLVLLASYANVDVDATVECLLVVGTNDGVLTRQRYDQAKEHLLGGFEECLIEGGNHAQFGSYGRQVGDNEATISPQRQVKETVVAMLDLCGSGGSL